MYSDHFLFIAVGGYLCWFPLVAIVGTAAVNINCVQVCLFSGAHWDPVIARSDSNSVFTFLRNGHISPRELTACSLFLKH